MIKNKVKLLIFLITALALVGCSRNMPDSSNPVAPTDVPGEPPAIEKSEATTVPVHPPIIVEPPEELDIDSIDPIISGGVEPLPLTVDEESLLALNNDPVPWGPGVHRDDKGRSLGCLDMQEKYGSHNASFISDEENIVTLSFDQGYENGYTPSILDILKEKEVQGIFFITGHYLDTSPELVQRMIDEGHIIGSHSDKHLVFPSATIDECIADLTTLQQEVRDQFNYEMQLFRFPEGSFSERSLALVDQMGFKSLFWSFAYKDWITEDQMSEEDAMAKISEFIHPGEIMLLHTVGETNTLILADAIDYIREQGYEVRPPSDILE